MWSQLPNVSISANGRAASIRGKKRRRSGVPGPHFAISPRPAPRETGTKPRETLPPGARGAGVRRPGDGPVRWSGDRDLLSVPGGRTLSVPGEARDLLGGSRLDACGGTGYDRRARVVPASVHPEREGALLLARRHPDLVDRDPRLPLPPLSPAEQPGRPEASAGLPHLRRLRLLPARQSARHHLPDGGGAAR